MKKLLFKLLLFLLPIGIFYGYCLWMPATPKVAKSLLFSELKKDSLLENVPSPRIIFVGGSNLSFGLNSQMIKDALHVNPVNTGVTAGLGLYFMMNNTIGYIQKGDIVVLIPEYQHFYNDYAMGQEELYRSVVDVKLAYAAKLKYRQFLNLIDYIPGYALTKFDSLEYIAPAEDKFYSVDSYNAYGDADKHWNSGSYTFNAYGNPGTKMDTGVLDAMEKFRNCIESKGAVLFVSYPGYQAKSFTNGYSAIQEIDAEYKKRGFRLLGTPERYGIADSLMLNTPYHLLKKGLDMRTSLLIEDLKKAEPSLLQKN